MGGEALFAPLNVLELVESRWGGHNPQVTEANVRRSTWPTAVRNQRRLATRRPQFRSVAEYEVGRPR